MTDAHHGFASISGGDFYRMLAEARVCLRDHRDDINALNVYPVPDGDTGTNMLATVESALDRISDDDAPLAEVAAAVSVGSLMGARGNSGVILSQLFRGLAARLEGRELARPGDVAAAMDSGVKAAYSAVMRPVEGTILTVARYAAAAAKEAAEDGMDVLGVLEVALDAAEETLDRTPQMLDVLAEAGVVDAGGYGLVCILRGCLAALKEERAHVRGETQVVRDERAAQTEPLVYPYDMVILMDRSGSVDGHALEELGDSLIVIEEGDMIKIHIHSDDPVAVMEMCASWGELIEAEIMNMDYQTGGLPVADEIPSSVECDGDFAVVPIAVGRGLRETFLRLGAADVVSGGPTMNPSTEDILLVVGRIEAPDKIILLPNNPNLILACDQVRTMSDRDITVIPTENIAQGLAALRAMSEDDRDFSDLVDKMRGAIERVTALEVTYAVDDRNFSGMTLNSGDIIGFVDGELLSVGECPVSVMLDLLDGCTSLKGGTSLLVFVGEGVDGDAVERLRSRAAEIADSLEIEIIDGGQNHYSFIAALW